MHQARSIFNISSTLDSQQSAALQQLQPRVLDKAVRHRYRHLKGLFVWKNKNIKVTEIKTLWLISLK